MSRSTQYIGLTDEGKEFVKNFRSIQNYSCEDGIAGEPIFYSRWLDVNTGKIYKEVTQYNPWSSGPMFFTCIEDERGNQYGKWARARYKNKRNEYDSKLGFFYI